MGFFIDGEYRLPHNKYRRGSSDDGFGLGGMVALIVDVAVFIFTSPGTWFAPSPAPPPSQGWLSSIFFSRPAPPPSRGWFSWIFSSAPPPPPKGWWARLTASAPEETGGLDGGGNRHPDNYYPGYHYPLPTKKERQIHQPRNEPGPVDVLPPPLDLPDDGLTSCSVM